MNRASELVKAWRRAQRPRITQADMAQRHGLAPITWWRIEHGIRIPSLEVAVALERAGICACVDWFEPAGAGREAA